jgi:hypothetical protein
LLADKNLVDLEFEAPKQHIWTFCQIHLEDFADSSIKSHFLSPQVV